MIPAVGGLHSLTSNWDEPEEWPREPLNPPQPSAQGSSSKRKHPGDDKEILRGKYPRYRTMEKLPYFNPNLREDHGGPGYASDSEFDPFPTPPPKLPTPPPKLPTRRPKVPTVQAKRPSPLAANTTVAAQLAPENSRIQDSGPGCSTTMGNSQTGAIDMTTPDEQFFPIGAPAKPPQIFNRLHPTDPGTHECLYELPCPATDHAEDDGLFQLCKPDADLEKLMETPYVKKLSPLEKQKMLEESFFKLVHEGRHKATNDAMNMALGGKRKAWMT
ncbi:hypothetical protein EDC01DRAFT_634122 [Geopyxis carbonaria]|nr:hypothetical protein EDC01DRAFT_634122 [Geopyxis carbonaria]